MYFDVCWRVTFLRGFCFSWGRKGGGFISPALKPTGRAGLEFRREPSFFRIRSSLSDGLPDGIQGKVFGLLPSLPSRSFDAPALAKAGTAVASGRKGGGYNHMEREKSL